jgi:hypothetical protein
MRFYPATTKGIYEHREPAESDGSRQTGQRGGGNNSYEKSEKIEKWQKALCKLNAHHETM